MDYPSVDVVLIEMEGEEGSEGCTQMGYTKYRCTVH